MRGAWGDSRENGSDRGYPLMKLQVVKLTSPQLLEEMERHYSQPKGFVGRNICYAVHHEDVCYGHIVGGSATRFLPGRDEFFGMKAKEHLNQFVNNIFFHIEPKGGEYPMRNFATEVIKAFERAIVSDWKEKYGDEVIGFETLVELPRTGECYRRAGWTKVGQTKGFTCKRVAGKGTDSWSGKRVWDTENLRPKNVLVKRVFNSFPEFKKQTKA